MQVSPGEGGMGTPQSCGKEREVGIDRIREELIISVPEPAPSHRMAKTHSLALAVLQLAPSFFAPSSRRVDGAESVGGDGGDGLGKGLHVQALWVGEPSASFGVAAETGDRVAVRADDEVGTIVGARANTFAVF